LAKSNAHYTARGETKECSSWDCGGKQRKRKGSGAEQANQSNKQTNQTNEQTKEEKQLTAPEKVLHHANGTNEQTTTKTKVCVGGREGGGVGLSGQWE
jgi:hypothetical protein